VSASADEIRDLMFEYCWLLDRGEIDAVGELMEHATVYGEGGLVLHGKDEIAGMFRDRAIMYDGIPRSKHLCTNVILDIDEDAGRATARSVYVAQQEAPGFPLQAYIAGRYRDTFERVDGAWRFAERVYIVDLLGDMSAHHRPADSG